MRNFLKGKRLSGYVSEKFVNPNIAYKEYETWLNVWKAINVKIIT